MTTLRTPKPGKLATKGAQAIVSALREAIEAGELREGDRIPTIRELSNTYGTTLNAARLAVQRLDVEMKLVRRCRGAGTFVHFDRPSTSANRAAVSNSALVLTRAQDRLHEILSNAVIEQLSEMGFVGVRVNPNREDSRSGSVEAMFSAWQDLPPRAIVLQDVLEPVYQKCRDLFAGRSVLISLLAERPDCHIVKPDYSAGIRHVTEWFLEQGHEKIGFVTYQRNISTPPLPREAKRRTGHTHAILEIGKVLRPSRRRSKRRGQLRILYNLIPQSPTSQNHAFEPVNIERAKEWLSRPDRPTAVFGDDNRIAGIVRAADAIGLRIPEDLLVVGQGNTEWSEAMGFPSLDFQPETIATQVVDLIDRGLDRLGETQHRITVPPKLVRV